MLSCCLQQIPTQPPNSIKTPWYKERSNFPCINSSGCCWRYNAVILTTFRTIWTFKHHSLSQYRYWPCQSLHDNSAPIYFQKDYPPCHKAHLKMISWTWQWVHCSEMTSTVKPVQHLVVEGVIPIMDMHPTRHVNMDHVESMPCRIKAVLRAGSVCVRVCGRDMVEMEAGFVLLRWKWTQRAMPYVGMSQLIDQEENRNFWQEMRRDVVSWQRHLCYIFPAGFLPTCPSLFLLQFPFAFSQPHGLIS